MFYSLKSSDPHSIKAGKEQTRRGVVQRSYLLYSYSCNTCKKLSLCQKQDMSCECFDLRKRHDKLRECMHYMEMPCALGPYGKSHPIDARIFLRLHDKFLLYRRCTLQVFFLATVKEWHLGGIGRNTKCCREAV